MTTQITITAPTQEQLLELACKMAFYNTCADLPEPQEVGCANYTEMLKRCEEVKDMKAEDGTPLFTIWEAYEYTDFSQALCEQRDTARFCIESTLALVGINTKS